MRRARIPLALLLAASLLVPPPPLLACGPFFPDAIFSYSVHPDFPLEEYAAGRLGILQPTYARSYLVVAYRYLAGLPLNAAEQQAVVRLWQRRLSFRTPWRDEPWLQAREEVPDVAPPARIGVYRSHLPTFSNYVNCHQDAFVSATVTLRARVDRFGLKSEAVREWVAAQDQVFANCSGPDPYTGGSFIPAEAPAGWDALRRADRAYQIAASHFYAGDFDAAAERFRQIAQDEDSPWQQWGSYLAARALVRKATLSEPEYDRVNREVMAAAETQLQEVLSNPALREMHPTARRLQQFIALRLRPEEMAQTLSKQLLRPDAAETLEQDLDDYTWLLDRWQGEPADELTDWIRTFQQRDSGVFDHAVEKWEASGSLPWLVAALTKVDAGNEKLSALLAAAAAVSSDSPAFAGVAYHRLRLLADAGRGEEARAGLDQLLAGQEGNLSVFPRSALNRLLALRFELSRNLDEFLRFAQRQPATVTYDDGRELPADYTVRPGGPAPDVLPTPHLAPEAALLLNERLPLAVLRRATESDKLEPRLRTELTLAVWVRAALLDDEGAARDIASQLDRQVPALQPYLRAYADATTSAERRYRAAYLILKHPGVVPYVRAGVGRETPLEKIDNFRENWWCPLESLADYSRPNFYRIDAPPTARRESSPTPKAIAFLSPNQAKAGVEEWKRLRETDTAPDYLTEQVLAWAKANPDDPSVPEALHLAVRATRYGCSDKDTTSLSRAAFQLLHRRYPENPWTKRTPYWY